MKKLKYILIFAVIATTAISCEDQLDLLPQQSLAASEALADFDAAVAALIGVYDRLQDTDLYGRELFVMVSVRADNAILSLDNSNRFTQNANLGWTLSNGDITSQWNDGYNLILRANTIIDNIDALEGGTQAEKDQVLGEAMFLRALTHFDLVKNFGKQFNIGAGSLGVPIILKSEIGEPARNTVTEVYNQVITDLNASINLMDNSEAPFRASQDAARALLSRVYLYMEDWSNSEAMASAVINSGRYSLVTNANYISSWETDGTSEEIFTMRFVTDESRGSDNMGSIYIQLSYGDIRASNDFMTLLGIDLNNLPTVTGTPLTSTTGDVRAGLIRAIEDVGVFDEFIYKFPEMGGVPGLASPRILRLGEMYLNRAEARAQQGNTADAQADLNMSRNRAGLGSITPTGAALMDAILLERRLELAFEGHRHYDMVRTGTNLNRGECNGISICTASFDDFRMTYPIPEREMEVNPNMVQNPGY